MKPVKKQKNPKIAKKPINEKNSTSGIKTFFKTAPKPIVVDQNVKEPAAASSTDATKKFYVDLLKEKLARIHDERKADDDDGISNRGDDDTTTEDCNIATLPIDRQEKSDIRDAKSTNECSECVKKASETDEWKEKYNAEVEERKRWKKLYFHLTHQFAELHSKHSDLLKAATKPTVNENSDPEGTGQSSGEIFTAAEVKFLQCMDRDKKNDCSFILHCLKYAYKGDLTVLPHRTLKGTAEWTKISDDGRNIVYPAKDPLTPKKVDQIKRLFVARVSECTIDASEYAERIKDPYVNKLIAAGIKNLSNTAEVKNSKTN